MGYFSRTYGTDGGTTCVDAADGGEKWTDDVQGTIEDSLFASCKLSGTNSGHLDYRQMAGYGTPWPSNTVITGVAVEILGYSDGAPDNHEIYSIFLAIDGVQEGDDIGPTGVYLPFSSPDWSAVVGGDSIMWGLTSAQIKAYTNNKKMGLLVNFNDTGAAGGTVYIDDVRVVIYYDVFKTHSLLGAGL